MLRWRTLLLTLTLSALLIVPVSAQEPTETAPTPPAAAAPLVFFGRGLYLMDETTRQVTRWDECGDSGRPRISPTGEWLAQIRDADIVRLCNLYTRKVIDVTTPEHPRAVDFQSIPAWSPDGTQVAWSVSYKDGGHSLYTYDLATGKARVLVEKLPPPGNIRVQVLWGKSGIAVVIDDQERSKRVAPLYSPDGKLLMTDLSGNQYFMSYFWVTDPTGKEYLGEYMTYNMGGMIDPTTGKNMGGYAPEMYSLLAPDGIALVMDYYAPSAYIRRPDDSHVLIADLSAALSEFVPIYQFDAINAAIAPDGKALAILDLDNLIWRDGKVTPLTGVPSGDGTGVIWGPTGYRVTPEIFYAPG